MCDVKGQRIQQIQQACETFRADFQDLTAKVSLSFNQVSDSLIQRKSEAQTWREHVERTFVNVGPYLQASDGQQNTQRNWKRVYKHN